jgi:hypothetical protein
MTGGNGGHQFLSTALAKSLVALGDAVNNCQTTINPRA